MLCECTKALNGIAWIFAKSQVLSNKVCMCVCLCVCVCARVCVCVCVWGESVGCWSVGHYWEKSQSQSLMISITPQRNPPRGSGGAPLIHAMIAFHSVSNAQTAVIYDDISCYT